MNERQELVQDVSLVFLAAFAVLAITSVPLPGPFVFADEGNYSLVTQHGWTTPIRFSTAGIPSYLFYSIYHVAFVKPQAASLIVARILNALFLSATAGIFYLLLRKYLRHIQAVLISIALILSYFGIFSIFFMPESLFFFLFWLTIYVYVAVDSLSPVVKAAGIGALTALLVLTKAHGMVIAAGWAVLLLLAPGFAYATNFRSRLASPLVFGVTLVLTWLVVSYVITGAIPDPIGNTYKGCVKARIDFASLLSTLKVALRHMGYLSFFYAFPLFVTTVVLKTRRQEAKSYLGRLLLAGLVFSLLLVGMCAKFTADVAGIGPYESVSRNHLRYYLVSLPLFAFQFFVSARIYVEELDTKKSILAVGFLAYVLGVLAIWATAVRGSNCVDAPMLLFANNRWVLFLSITLGALAFGFAACNRKRHAVGAWLAFFFLAGLSSYGLALGHWWSADMGRFSRMASIIRECLPDGLVQKDVLFLNKADYSAVANPFILQYHLGAPVKWHHVRDIEKEVDCSLISQYMVVVTFGNIALDCDFATFAADGDVRVFRSKKDSNIVHYVFKYSGSRGLMCGGSYSLEGFHSREPWGVWTKDETAAVDLDRRFKGNVRLKLTMSGFGPNAGRPVLLRFGELRKVLIPTPQVSEFIINGTLQQPANSITMSGMQPTSPREASNTADERKLGIGLVDLSIEENIIR